MKDKAYFEIRLESLGGLGANLCGKMLGELGVKYLGLNGAAFSSYGSEKRGSPVSSFIRWCDGDKEILINSPVREPLIYTRTLSVPKSIPISDADICVPFRPFFFIHSFIITDFAKITTRKIKYKINSLKTDKIMLN